MTLEVDLVTLYSKAPEGAGRRVGGSLSTPNKIVQAFRAWFASNPVSVADGPMHVKHQHYADLGLAAYYAVKNLPAFQGWTLEHTKPYPSIDNGDGTWTPGEGISFLVQSSSGPLVNIFGAKVEHFVSIHPAQPEDPNVKHCQVCPVNDTTMRAEGIALFYTHTRTRILGIEVRGRTGISAAPIARGVDTIWKVQWVGDVQPGERICLEATYVGDPPHVRARTWLGEEPPDAPAGHAGPFEVPPRALKLAAAATLLAYERTWEEELQHRKDLIAAPDSTDKPLKQFWLELDEKTTPRAPLPEQEQKEYVMLGNYLALRFFQRAERVNDEKETAFDEHEVETWREITEAVADRVKAIFLAHLSNASGGLDAERATEAFEKFAGGELTVFETHGAPDGVNYFAFCELAILLQEMDHDQRFWDPLLPIFARTAEIFVNAYHQCCGPRTECSYQVGYNPEGSRAYDAAAKQSLAKEWNALDPVVEFGRVVHAALYDDLFPGTRVPRALQDSGCPEGLRCGGSGESR